MASTLGKVLNYIEESREAVVLSKMAADLGTSPALLEGMLEYWVQKGKLKASFGEQNCGDCAKDGDCPFVLDGPKSYELVGNEGLIGLAEIQICDFEKV